MDATPPSSESLSRLSHNLQKWWQWALDAWNSTGVVMRNEWRLLRRRQLDYVVMPVGGPLPERAGPPRNFIQRHLPLPPEPLSMQALNNRLRAIADASNVKGVILILESLDIGLATAGNLRRSIQRLRSAGKKVIVYTPHLDLGHYFVASAAEQIIVPPTTRFDVVGVRSEVVFVKETLARLGIEADVLQISPYKTAYNALSHQDMSPEQREQLNWLLDDTFDLVTAGMAEGRGKSQAEIKTLIDQAPLSAQAAQAAGLVDHLAYEDELEKLLAEGERPAKLLPWSHAYSMLMEKARRITEKYIGVISLQGLIAMGPSRQPPVDLPLPYVGGEIAGEQTLLQLLRVAERSEWMAAVILHVDSGGGSALASDLIGREIKRLNEKKPVLAYMGNLAASGGYYVSAPARHIMSQSSTITGSIGVLTMRLNTAGLYEKLGVNRVSLHRGQHAGLYSDLAPLSAEERELLWREVADTYQAFKQVVADGRQLALNGLDTICEGRVWSGRQALGHKLVDSHGDFVDAINQAAILAGLPVDDAHHIPVANLYVRGREYILPQPLAALQQLWRTFLEGQVAEWNGRPLCLLPYTIRLV
ncbi:MAG: signal peptide peptidase SppA [Chloroflexota bacterium]